MPEDWEKKYDKFAADLKRYQRKGKNEHDDAPDALTGIVEMVNGEVKGRKKATMISQSKFFGGMG